MRVAQLVSLAALLLFAVVFWAAGQSTSRPVPATRAQFTDVAPQSHFTYVTRNDYRRRKYFIQPICGGVAIFDYDNDGQQDIFFTNGSGLPSMRRPVGFNNCLLRNRGHGVFVDQTIAAGLAGSDMGYSFGVAAGDYDNDGYADLFICNAGTNRLFHNNRDGTFSDVSAGSGLTKPAGTLSVGAAWFDYDNDGLPDLVVSNYTVWSPESDFRCEDALRREIYCSPTRFVSVPDRLYHNLGNGKFEDVTDKAGFGQALGKGMGISIADANGDGLPDVFVINDTERNFLFINQGNGTFREEGVLYGIAFNDDGVEVSGMASDLKDFDNDGLPDLFYNDLPRQVFALFLNQGGKMFRYASPTTALSRLSYRLGGWSGGFVDYDNDGWKDIYSANGDVDYYGDNAQQSDTMFHNLGGKSLEDVSKAMGAAFTRRGWHRGSAFGDLNNDGSQDIVVTALNETPRILMNSGTPGSHWILLALTGSRGSKDAIGAAVKLTTESHRTLYNHVSVSTGFMSSSDRRVHFGLGAEAGISSLEIRWPSGQVQVLHDVKPDRILKVREPQ